MRWPAEALAAQGCDVRVADSSWRLMVTVDSHTGRPRSLMSTLDCDVIVLQRLALGAYVDALPLVQASGVRVVVDVDDDFGSIDPNNAAYAAYHPRTSPASNFKHLARACQVADLVTVSTKALAGRYGAHGRVRVVPNRVPRKAFQVQPASNVLPVVGWAGAVNTHPRDLQVTRGQVARAVRDTNTRFLHVGPTGGVAEALGFDVVASTGLVAHDKWYETIAALDIAIGPLASTRFNQAKSALRGLEAAAAGSAVVASPAEDYRRVARDGVCLLAESPRDWYRHVRKLVVDDAFRADVRGRAREGAGLHVLEDHVGEWFDAWKGTLK